MSEPLDIEAIERVWRVLLSAATGEPYVGPRVTLTEDELAQEIATAPTTVLALIAEVKRLRAGVAELAETMRYPECGEPRRDETRDYLRRLLGDDC